jgi:aminoglycoside N3'-acetyltransferase
MAESSGLSRAELTGILRGSGLAGRTVCLHSSLRSLGRMEDGADGAIAAFLEAGCTLIVPAFTYASEIDAPPGFLLERNAQPPPGSHDPAEPYRPDGNPISREMGAIPARLLGRPGTVRGNHPLNSFAGLGPRAAEILAGQAPLDVYAPFRSLSADPQAVLVLAGVGLTRATAIHYAEERAGRRLFRRWALLAGGETVEVEAGSCSEGFENLADAVRPLERRIGVGAGIWRVFPFAQFVDAAARAIRSDPAITRCADPACARCEAMVAGGPILADGRDIREGPGSVI